MRAARLSRSTAFVFFLALPGAGRAAPDTPAAPGVHQPDAIRAEAKRRHDALVAQGFNFTNGISLGTSGEGILRVVVLVPPSEGEHHFVFWAATPEGEIAFRFVGADGGLRAAWAGRRGETDFAVSLPPGRYSVEIDRSRAKGGEALLGFKGPIVRRCPADARAEEVAADAGKGFAWPYLLRIPKDVRSRAVLVAPNNTGFTSDDVELLRASASCEVQRQSALADRLGAPLLVPLFPRPPAKGEDDSLYLHALTRAALETKTPAYRRVDLQLVAMLDDARARLRTRGAETRENALLWGFSASGSFVSRFALLHPTRVLAVASGSPGGWPIAPAAESGGATLPYPVGIADVKALTGETVEVAAARSVAFLFFLGEKDANDSVPFRDSFSKSDETLVFRLFGPTPISRWKAAERLYGAAGLNARFALYPGAAHEMTKEMDEDVARFFEGVLVRASR